MSCVTETELSEVKFNRTNCEKNFLVSESLFYVTGILDRDVCKNNCDNIEKTSSRERKISERAAIEQDSGRAKATRSNLI